ncbi:methylated-DNA--[protein]-cysteine S-methyltransferase [Paenibacillus sp. M1]|uniref:Methylated-DNA--protein-cysteine methyltransferase n=1 Tax=Paenibacillus haidiansis TaxID=1574488 RepID=A0ABU7VVW4_9BACL
MKKSTPIYWMQLQFEDWSLYLAATESGLCYVGSQGADYQELADWAARRFPGSPLLENQGKLRPFAAELTAYLRGEITCFSLPLELAGTPFQRAVWNALCAIPYGETASYSDIAKRIGKPAAVRAVGTAIGANPVLLGVPCHRVIGKNGALTGYRGGLEMKTRLLQLERDAAYAKEISHK